MSDDLRNFLMLMVAGLTPFTLLGGWGPEGDASIWPWAACVGGMAGVVIGYRARLRWGPHWWRPWRLSYAFKC